MGRALNFDIGTTTSATSPASPLSSSSRRKSTVCHFLGIRLSHLCPGLARDFRDGVMMDGVETGRGRVYARSNSLPAQGAWGMKCSLRTDETKGYWHRRTAANVCHSGVKAGLFAGVGVFALIFYASGIPRVQKDILQVRYFHVSGSSIFSSAIANKPPEGSLHWPQVQEGDPCF